MGAPMQCLLGLDLCFFCSSVMTWLDLGWNDGRGRQSLGCAVPRYGE